jgi:transcriptional regulator with XRE-family HTH domain
MLTTHTQHDTAGSYIRAYRKAHNLTRAQFAIKHDLVEVTLGRIENDTHAPSFTTLQRMQRCGFNVAAMLDSVKCKEYQC